MLYEVITLVPGYFADPTIRKFGDTWYLYATTDGIKLASGDPQVWVSKDFKNWCNYRIELPNRKTEDVWAPEVVEGPDGRYYYYFSSRITSYNVCYTKLLRFQYAASGCTIAYS